jgi:hypothetical protein
VERNFLFIGCRIGKKKILNKVKKFSKNVFQNSSIPLISYYQLLKNRGDLHHGGNDCTYWNFDFEMWNGIFYLLDVAFEKKF